MIRIRTESGQIRPSNRASWFGVPSHLPKIDVSARTAIAFGLRRPKLGNRTESGHNWQPTTGRRNLDFPRHPSSQQTTRYGPPS